MLLTHCASQGGLRLFGVAAGVILPRFTPLPSPLVQINSSRSNGAISSRAVVCWAQDRERGSLPWELQQRQRYPGSRNRRRDAIYRAFTGHDIHLSTSRAIARHRDIHRDRPRGSIAIPVAVHRGCSSHGRGHCRGHGRGSWLRTHYRGLWPVTMAAGHGRGHTAGHDCGRWPAAMAANYGPRPWASARYPSR
jgi:hypothetical protein